MGNKIAESLFYEKFKDLLFPKDFLWKNNEFVKFKNEIFYSVYLVPDDEFDYDVMVSCAPIFCNFPDDKGTRSMLTSMKKTGLIKSAEDNFLSKDVELETLFDKYYEVCESVYSKFLSYDNVVEYTDYTSLFLYKQFKTTDVYSNRVFDDSLRDLNIFDVVYALYRTYEAKEAAKKIMDIISVIGDYFYSRIEFISNIIRDKQRYEAELKCVNILKNDYDKIREFLQAVFEDNRAYLFSINREYEEIEKKNREYLKSLELI